MMLELGGGRIPRFGYVNLDIVPLADIVFDLDCVPPDRLPLEDQSVEAVFSSHCLEHVRSPFAVLQEVARVCVVGAPVEIRVPHPLSDLAMTYGHQQVISPVDIQNVLYHFRSDWWPTSVHPRRLELVREEYSPSCYFDRLRGLYPGWSEDDVLRFAPRASHDIRFHMRVVAND